MLSVKGSKCAAITLSQGDWLRRGGFSMRKKQAILVVGGGARPSTNCRGSFEQGSKPPQPTLGPDSAPCPRPAAPGSSTLPP